MSALAINVERLAMNVQGLPEATVREALAGLDAEMARLLAERAPVAPRSRELALMQAAPLSVPRGTGADALRRLLAEHLLTALAPAPGGAD